jgi:hypothetical protein
MRPDLFIRFFLNQTANPSEGSRFPWLIPEIVGKKLKARAC